MHGQATRDGTSYISFMDTQITSLAVIQAMLAPGLGISAVGLLLLGMSNRYGAIIARIRALNNEKRGFLKLMAQGKTLEYSDNVRYQSVVRQTDSLLEQMIETLRTHQETLDEHTARLSSVREERIGAERELTSQGAELSHAEARLNSRSARNTGWSTMES